MGIDSALYWVSMWVYKYTYTLTNHLMCVCDCIHCIYTYDVQCTSYIVYSTFIHVLFHARIHTAHPRTVAHRTQSHRTLAQSHQITSYNITPAHSHTANTLDTSATGHVSSRGGGGFGYYFGVSLMTGVTSQMNCNTLTTVSRRTYRTWDSTYIVL